MDFAFATGFAIVFLVIGGLELVDRTSFALIAFATRAHAFASWAGASTAFLLTTGLSVTVGAALVAELGTGRIGLVRVAGGVFLIGYAAWVYFHPEEEESPHLRVNPRSAFIAAFLTIFLLELGDSTMIFEIVFVANFGWFVVFVAGSLALVSLAAWNVHVGRTIAARVSPRLLNRIFVVVLTIVGAVTIAYGLAPSAFPSIGFAAST